MQVLVSRIILVRPRNPMNIGACARAMGNFGFSDLVVVDPYLPIWRETQSAPDAEAIVHKARKVATLKEAVRGCSLILGTSSMSHRRLEQAVVPLPALSTFLSKRKSGRLGLVFGSERSGLSNQELSDCEAIVQIPMAPSGVSMNLAQAVAVVLYEVIRFPPKKQAPASERQTDEREVIEEWIRLAGAAGYPPGYTPVARAGRIRKAMRGVPLTSETAHFLMSFSRWVRKKMNQRNRGIAKNQAQK